MKITTNEKIIDHPLEDAFGIETGTTIMEYHECLPEKPVDMVNYDKKDDEIEIKLEEIYSTAMGQVMLIADQMELVEGKYKARVGEVTATMLNVALGSVREKRMMKEHKDKLSPSKYQGNVHNTLIVGDSVLADRNELLRAFMAPAIEANK